ncbi:MAG TPA: histidine phosphatase family protein [Anaerolineales bacterium]|nr:histidine phosphatase family protein [Anaerolineales bacterium]
MKTLLILRHAKSDWADAGLPDHDRPLNKRGEREAPLMGELLRTHHLVPDLILSSTATRARHTAELVAQAGGYAGEILTAREMYLAEPEGYVEAIHLYAREEPIVMIVGHNPGIEDLAAKLTDQAISMTTANLIHVTLPIESWQALRETTQGKLVHFWRPKEI